jgi:hypothetical protein
MAESTKPNLEFRCEDFCKYPGTDKGIKLKDGVYLCSIEKNDCPVLALYILKIEVERLKDEAESRAGNIPPGYGYDPRFGVTKVR